MRLIDADALIKSIGKYMDWQDLYLPIHFKDWVIDNAPTIDAVPVVRCKDCIAHQCCRFEKRLGANGYCSFFKDYGKAPWADGERHGRWIYMNGFWKCSECNKDTLNLFKWCPYCGAKMDGEEDD